MRDYKKELEKRVEFIKEVLKESHASGIVFGNSGGKDCALVGILCRKACDNVLSVIMPCTSRRNYNEDMEDARKLETQFGIESMTVDLTPVKEAALAAVEENIHLTDMSAANMNPRLRMLTLYSIAQTRNALVAGTGNASERYMGYFTKWGDGGCDFNPIADLTATEVFEFLRYLEAPPSIIEKAPSAALFEGQTDEAEMGITYAELDEFILNGNISEENRKLVESAHRRTEHKRVLPRLYEEKI